MALKRRNEFRQFENVSEINITPNEGEAWRVHDIQVKSPATETFMEIHIGKATVGFFPVYDGKYEFFPVPEEVKDTVNILESLRKAGVELIYPVSQGESFIINFTNPVERVRVIYDVYDVADVRPTEPNGSKSDVLTYMAVVTNSQDITDENYHKMDKLLNPAEMPDFPIDIVPSGYRLQVHTLF